MPPAPHPSPRLEVRLPADSAAPGLARRALERLPLRRPVRDDLAIIVSELVTNSVVHGAGGDITLRAEVGGTVRVEVHDGGPCFEPGPADMPLGGLEGGRGLPLVAALSLRWGVEDRDGCTAWAEVAT